VCPIFTVGSTYGPVVKRTPVISTVSNAQLAVKTLFTADLIIDCAAGCLKPNGDKVAAMTISIVMLEVYSQLPFVAAA